MSMNCSQFKPFGISAQSGVLLKVIRIAEGLVGAAILLITGLFHAAGFAQSNPNEIDLGTREAVVFKVDGTYGGTLSDITRVIVESLPAMSKLPLRKLTSDGCDAWVNFKCTHVDPKFITYKGVSFLIDRQGQVVLRYEESSKNIFVPIKVSMKKSDNMPTLDVSIEFPRAVKPIDNNDLMLKALGSLFGKNPFPMATPDELRLDITGVFDGLKEAITSGKFVFGVAYSISDEIKSEYPPASISANFERLASSWRKDGEKFTALLKPEKFEKSGREFYVYVQIFPFRNGSAIKYAIPLAAKLYTDGRAEADPEENVRKEILLKIINS